jgi:probable HAF family extracellular repeat protein
MVTTFAHPARGAVIIAAVGVVFGFTVPTANAVEQQHDVGIVDLGLLPGGTYSTATIVGDDGTVVGAATTAAGGYHAVRWQRNGRITDLGTLPGHTQSQVTAMNSAGVLVGFSNAPALVGNQAVRWDESGRITALAPGLDTSTPVDINAAGQATGSVASVAGERAVRWSRDGRRIVYLAVPPDAPLSSAAGITERGTVGGIVSNPYTYQGSYAVRWPPGWWGVEVLDTYPGGWGTWVTGIDDNDVVIGGVFTHLGQRALRWDAAGHVADLSLPPGAMRSVATVVDASGFVLGYVTTPAGERAARWDPSGALTLLDNPPGNSAALVGGVNFRGEVVGQVTMPDSTTYAARWDRGGRVTLLPRLPGGSYAGAAAINEHGTAVGYAVTADNSQHAVMWR